MHHDPHIPRNPGSNDPASSASPEDLLDRFFQGVRLAPPQEDGALRIHPLVTAEAFAEASPDPGWLSLAEALESGLLEIREKPGGSVPELEAHNRGERDVLILAGEWLRGGLQDRVANSTFLVPAGERIDIDVACVEAGRWHARRSRRFRPGPGLVAHELKRKLSQAVRESLARGGRRRAYQAEVWREVSERLARARVTSPTEAYARYEESRGAAVEARMQRFTVLDGQVGIVASIAGEVVGVEALGSAALFERVFPRLLRSFVVDAIEEELAQAGGAGGPRSTGDEAAGGADPGRAPRRRRPAKARPRPSAPRFEDPEAFLEALARAERRRFPSPGGGIQLGLEGERVEGSALVAERVAHLTASPRLGEPGGGRGWDGEDDGPGGDGDDWGEPRTRFRELYRLLRERPARGGTRGPGEGEPPADEPGPHRAPNGDDEEGGSEAA